MIKTIAIIPARKGSKRLPGKNTTILGDKPLIGWTIEAAIESDKFDEIIVTTDDPRIMETAEYYNIQAKFRHPKLCGDEVTLDAVIIDALIEYPIYTVAVLLQPTTPFRDSRDIKIAVDLFYKNNQDYNVVSACWKGGISADIKINGGIYITPLSKLISSHKFIHETTLMYLMPKERSIDIDYIEDLNKAREILNGKCGN